LPSVGEQRNFPAAIDKLDLAGGCLAFENVIRILNLQPYSHCDTATLTLGLRLASAFIRNSGVDVVGVHFEKQLGHLRERRWSLGIDSRAEPGGPSQPNQIPIVRIVVGMLVGQEDVA
jgi:hypothetical protein